MGWRIAEAVIYVLIGIGIVALIRMKPIDPVRRFIVSNGG